MPTKTKDDFQTPKDICQYMVNLLPRNLGTVLEPTPGAGNLVEALVYAGYKVTAPEHFCADAFKGAYFDAVVMNPPFTPMSKGYQILEQVMQLSSWIVALMPWMTIINSQRRTRQIESWGLLSITHLPRSVFPGSRVQTCILQMKKRYDGVTRFYIKEKK